MKKLLIFFIFFVGSSHAWTVHFEKLKYTIYMGDKLHIPFNVSANANDTEDILIHFDIGDTNIAKIDSRFSNLTVGIEERFVEGLLIVDGLFLGTTELTFYGTKDEYFGEVSIFVVRKDRPVDHAFTASVAILVSLLYINFGCALDWSLILKTPVVAPALGLTTQFVGMPLLSYLIGWALFSENPAMRLGVLFVGVSPAGGASNIWTCVLDGNIELSVTMTAISTLFSFFMMPMWLFTLGRNIFLDAKIEIPFVHIASLAAALVVPLGIGHLIQRKFPNMARRLARLLKVLSALLIIYIIIFAAATNFYMFRLFSWRILFAGFALPFCGYITGALIAVIGRRPPRDVVAIAVETGVQNTGIAIFLLRFALPAPQNDLTTVVPVSMAIMTPVPLVIMYIYKRFTRSKGDQIDDSISGE